jgi:hypothetical protein
MLDGGWDQASDQGAYEMVINTSKLMASHYAAHVIAKLDGIGVIVGR